MHIVEITMRHIVGASLRMEALDAPLDRGFLEYLLDPRLGIDRKDHAPDPTHVVAPNLEQRAQFLRVSDVIGQRIAMWLEVIAGAQHEEAFLVGEAREF